MSEFLTRYNELQKLIEERQAFENQVENKIPPFETHRTDVNFYDIHGYTLLQYACLLGDIDAVKDLLKKGADPKLKSIFVSKTLTISPLQMALEQGHIEVAQFLFAQGSACNEIPAAKVHQNCRQWFNEQVSESLAKSYPGLSRGNLDKNQSSPFFTNYGDSPLPRIVELGQLDVIKALYDTYKDNPNLSQSLLNTAVCNGHKDIVNFLLSIDLSLNPQTLSYIETPLHKAVEYRQHDMITLLLERGANIDRQNEGKETPLMIAVANNDIEMVKLLMEKKANLLLKDRYGNTVLHYAVRQNSLELSKLLLTDPYADTLLNEKNVYGFKAADIAIDAGNEEQLMLLMDGPSVKAAVESPEYAKNLAPIDQRTALRKMHYCLRINYLDLDYFPVEGACNGLSFLRSLYGTKYFTNTMRLISGWSGRLLDLYQPFSEELPQASFYINLSMLIEQWTQDMIWFQASTLSGVFYTEQNQREKQFAMVLPVRDLENSVITIHKDRFNRSISVAQLTELFFLIQRMPTAIQFNISGSSHLTNGTIEVQNENIDYYDPNFQYELDATIQSNLLVQLIIDTKFRALKQMLPGDVMDVGFHSYYFKNKTNETNLNEFILFSDNELPSSKEEAQRYQGRSPNNFTPLHAAIFTGSLKTFARLLEEDNCDIVALNGFGESVFDMASASRNVEFMKLILKYAADKFNIGKAIIQSAHIQDDDFFKLLITYANDRDRVALCCRAIEQRDKSYAEQFINDNSKEILDLLSSSNKRLLHEALKIQDLHLVSLLLNKGVDLGVLVNNEFGDKLSLVEYAMRNFNSCRDFVLEHVFPNSLDENGFAPIHYAARDFQQDTIVKLVGRQADPNLLSHEAKTPLEIMLQNTPLCLRKWTSVETLLSAGNSIHLSPLVQANVSEQWQSESKLLEEIKFDLNNPMQRTILALLIVSAIKFQQADMFELLIARGDLTSLNQLIDGKPILVHAVASKNLSMVRALLEKGVFVDAVTIPGKNSGLHIALKLHCPTDFVKLLLEYNANPNLENRVGENPASLAAGESLEIQGLFSPSQGIRFF